jgi:hypothetical protein
VKKILFVTTSSLESENYSGDAIRALNIIEYLKKNNNVDIVSVSKKNEYNKITQKGKEYFFKKNNILLKLFYTFISLLKLKPLQLGYFYSNKIEKFLKDKHKDYDTIIFHLIRSAQYLPKEFKGKKILEMTDLMSNNYNQTKKHLSLFNIFYYLYFLEGFLVSIYEKYCSKIFDKIILVSKKDINFHNKQFNKKVIEITSGIKIQKKTFKFNKKNYKILFIGNINYLPNKYACYHFAKNILPKINKTFPEIEFHIIGEINRLDKIKLEFFNNVKILGKIKSLRKNINLAICGVSNLEIATGIQNKIFTYMSYALPTIASLKSSSGIKGLIEKKDLLIYQDKKKLIEQIIKLKKNRLLSNQLSRNSYNKIKKISWEKTLKNYNKII